MAQKKYVSLSKLSTFLDKLKETFSVIGHKHTFEDVGLTVDTELSSTSTNPVQNKVIDAEFEAMSVAMNALDSAINNKADSEHPHAISDVENLQETLDALQTNTSVEAITLEELAEIFNETCQSV